MSFQDGYKQSQDFDLQLIYLAILITILALVTISNVPILYKFHKGSLQTSNIALRIILTTKVLVGLVYVWLDCSRRIAFVSTYDTDEPILLETHVGCRFYFLITSAAQYTVSLTITWATLKRVLHLRHQRFHDKYITPLLAVIFVIGTLLFSIGINIHYFNLKEISINFSDLKDYGINGTHKACSSEPGSSYEKFWNESLPMMDSIIHIMVPALVWIPVYVAIEVHFEQDDNRMFTLTPAQRNKLRHKRQNDRVYIIEIGWTRAITYTGMIYLVSNLPLNVYLWYYKLDKFHALLSFSEDNTKSGLITLQLLMYVPYLFWFPIYYLSGCDGKKAVQSKTISTHMLPVGSHYSLRSRSSTSSARARSSKSAEENRL